jgi:nitrite reductase (NADH) small subunit
VIACDWHGLQFDLRSGECLTVAEKIETYQVVIEDGLISVVV